MPAALRRAGTHTCGGSDERRARRDPALAAAKRCCASSPDAGSSPARPASSDRICSRRCCGSARRVVGLDNFSTGYRAQPRRRAARGRRRRLARAIGSSRATSATSMPAGALRRASTSCCTRRRSARCRARSRIRSRRTPPTSTGFLNMLVAARDARGRPFRVRRIELDLRRPPAAAEGRGRDRPSAVALRGHASSSNELYADVFGRCYGLSTVGLALLQRVRPAPGSRTVPTRR